MCVCMYIMYVCVCMHTLTNTFSRVLVEKLTVSQLVKFPAFHGTRRFITVYTTAHHLSLPEARLNHSTFLCCFFNIHFNVILLGFPCMYSYVCTKRTVLNSSVGVGDVYEVLCLIYWTFNDVISAVYVIPCRMILEDGNEYWGGRSAWC